MKTTKHIIALAALFFLLGLKSFAQDAAMTAQPTASIAGISKGEITKDALLKAGTIVCDIDKAYITHFDFGFVRKAEFIQLKSVEAKLTTEMRESIQQMVPGDKIFIDDITAKSETSGEIKLPMLLLIIK